MIQMEQKQINNPSSVTYDYISDHIQPPEHLKYANLIKGPDRATWERGMCNELGRLAQGYKDIKGKDTIFLAKV